MSIANIPSDVVAVLPGVHLSPETAYVVDDYPYGFRLRCSIRYWLDVSKHGARLMSQTTNPKVPGVRWNKPKASTYRRFAGALYLDSAGHVQWAGLSEYSDAAEAVAYRDTFAAGVPESMRLGLDAWVAAKLAYEAASAENGGDMRASAAAGHAAFVQVLKAAKAAKLATGEESV